MSPPWLRVKPRRVPGVKTDPLDALGGGPAWPNQGGPGWPNRTGPAWPNQACSAHRSKVDQLGRSTGGPDNPDPDTGDPAAVAGREVAVLVDEHKAPAGAHPHRTQGAPKSHNCKRLVLIARFWARFGGAFARGTAETLQYFMGPRGLPGWRSRPELARNCTGSDRFRGFGENSVPNATVARPSADCPVSCGTVPVQSRSAPPPLAASGAVHDWTATVPLAVRRFRNCIVCHCGTAA